MRLAPGSVALTHRLDQPVVGQLVPGCAAALLAAHQVYVDQLADNPILQPGALPSALQDLAADALFGDQLGLEPVAYLALAHSCRVGDRGHAILVIASQGAVDIADRGHMLLVDLAVV